MKYICLNLKRFEVPRELGGVNSFAPVLEWGSQVVSQTQQGLRPHQDKARFFQYLPEAHLLPALQALGEDAPITLGCQGLHWQDVTPGGNFGAFTSLRPAAAMRALGVGSAIIGHCEERRAKAELLAAAGLSEFGAVNRLLNQELLCAANAGINRKAEEATIAAHRQVLPVFQINLPRIDEEGMGWLYAQFMAACAVSARLLDVNPFDQEGVEDYKRRMFAALGR